MLVVIVLGILVALCFVAWRFGVFDQFKMEAGRLLSCEVVYLTYQGEYSKIGPLFEEVNKDCASVFKFSSSFGFYFDNPEETAPEKCRAIVGIIINDGEEFKISEFIKKHPSYSQKTLLSTKYVSYEMPFINILSILLMVKVIYPKINEYLKKTDIINVGDISGIMEVYKCVRQDKKIEIIVPVENQEQFRSLWAKDMMGSEAHENEMQIRREQSNERQFNINNPKARRPSQNSQEEMMKKD